MVVNRSAATGPIAPTWSTSMWAKPSIGFALLSDSKSASVMDRRAFTQSVADVAPQEWGGTPARSG